MSFSVAVIPVPPITADLSPYTCAFADIANDVFPVTTLLEPKIAEQSPIVVFLYPPLTVE